MPVQCNRRDYRSLSVREEDDAAMKDHYVPSLTEGIFQGDCIDGMKALPAESVHLVFADPPFNIGYQYDVYRDQLNDEEYVAWCREWTGEVARILRPDGSFWLAIGDEYVAELKVMIQQCHRLALRSWVVWYYTFGVHCKRKFTRSHAHLLYWVKDPKSFTFNDGDIRVPSARQLVYGDKRANPRGRLPDDTWILRPQDVPDGFRPDEDTWYFPRVCGTFRERAGFHGCQMPEQLLGRIISACSRPGEWVLDPFAGSGTTLAVAKKLERRYLGFELSPEYTANIRRRLEAVQPGDPLEGSADPLKSVPSTDQGRRLEDVNSKPKRRRFVYRRPASSAEAGPPDGRA